MNGKLARIEEQEKLQLLELQASTPTLPLRKKKKKDVE
jgi:hypothetical protein